MGPCRPCRAGRRGCPPDPRTGGGQTHEAPAVILATGSAYKEPGLPEEKKLSGHGESWCATCDGFFFREQDIMVVGGGDSAMEEATFLTRFAKTVTVVVRKNELRTSRIMAQRAPPTGPLQGTTEVQGRTTGAGG
ncbi:hypothetical protein A5N17_18865 [Arthrobacter sp. D2]|nr:hypothetical protein [Arthrobacter sp. M5]NKR15442.1 hypothetical protein [Arthrobacter sp. M6]OEH59310.1 hypothetical protein A5N17_18865 [Arthrobacter sp. D2]OEH60707.1 hypothetical protein A5N13_17570 [Arthrobacter sp. D4]